MSEHADAARGGLVRSLASHFDLQIFVAFVVGAISALVFSWILQKRSFYSAVFSLGLCGKEKNLKVVELSERSRAAKNDDMDDDDDAASVDSAAESTSASDDDSEDAPLGNRNVRAAKGGSDKDMPPPIPSIRLVDEANGGTELLPNTRKPFRVSNEWFEGRALVLVRSKPEDPFYAPHFKGKQRRFEVQVQGRFKVKPRGTVYIGGEVPRKMQLGLFTRGLTGTLLRILKARSKSSIHYSFGRTQNGSLVDLPHICLCMWNAVDRFVLTKAGSEPPKLGQQLPETDRERNVRRKRRAEDAPEFNTADTISFSYHSMYLDLATWKIVNIKGIDGVSLSTFWGDMPLKMVLYDVPPDTKTSDVHVTSSNRYFFSWSMHSIPDAADAKRGFNVLGGKQGNDDEFDDEASEGLNSPQPARTQLTPALRTLRARIRVPCWMEYNNARTRRRNVAFLAVVSKEGVGTETRALRKLGDFHAHFPTLNIALVASRRLWGRSASDVSRRKRAYMFGAQQHDLAAFFSSEKAPGEIPSAFAAATAADSTFLAGNRKDFGIPAASGQVLLESAVLRAQSESFWREEFLCLVRVRDYKGLLMYRAQTKSPEVVLSLSDLRVVHDVDVNDSCAMPSLRVETLGREFIFCFPNEALANTWHSELLAAVSPKVGADDRAALGEPAAGEGDYLVKIVARSKSIFNVTASRLHDEKRRVVLNSRRIVFCSNLDADPCKLSAHCLRMLLNRTTASASPAQLIATFNALSDLKSVSVAKRLEAQPETYRLAFFLNLYHITLFQARLLVGQPNTMFGWNDFGNKSCIAVGTGSDSVVFSLLEIEHCIIRAAMSSANSFWTKLSGGMSATAFTRRVALKKPDFRVNFALNYGTISCPSTVCVFTPDGIDEQLNAMARLYLDKYVSVSPSGRSIKMPRICKWYGRDFDDQGLVASILPFLSEKKKAHVEAARENKARVKFRRFSWRSRPNVKAVAL